MKTHKSAVIAGDGSWVYREERDLVVRAIETVLSDGPQTADLGGNANATEVGKAIAVALA